MDANLIKEILKKSIFDSVVEVIDTTGTNDHFKVSVISDTFEGMTLINRHKLIYKSLNSFITKEIHAIQIYAKTNKEASNE